MQAEDNVASSRSVLGSGAGGGEVGGKGMEASRRMSARDTRQRSCLDF